MAIRKPGSRQFFATTSSAPDLNDPQVLLSIAREQGGVIQDVAEEMLQPERNFLSSIADTGKKALKGFIEAISTPSQVIAGVIDPNITVKDAIQKNISPSDVIFGDMKKDLTTGQKVGNFVIRLSTDVLLDPLTYLTFGAVRGVFGVTSRIKVPTIEAKTGKEIFKEIDMLNKKPGDFLALSDEGEKIYLNSIKRQREGLEAGVLKDIDIAMSKKLPKEVVGSGTKSLPTKELLEDKDFLKSIIGSNVDDVYNKFLTRHGDNPEVKNLLQGLNGDKLDRLLKGTIKADLDPRYAKEVISNFIASKARHGGAEVLKKYLDQGGIKFFGKTMLSGQRISSAIRLIPGMSWIDSATKGSRRLLGSMFNRDIDIVHGRVPEELTQSIEKWEDLRQARLTEEPTKIMRAWNDLGITVEEDSFIRAAIEYNTIPSDERLRSAWMVAKGIDSNQLSSMRQAGIKVAEVPNHIAHGIFTDDAVREISWSGVTPPRQTIGTAGEAKVAKFVDVETGEVLVGHKEVLKLKEIPEEALKNVQDDLKNFLSAKNIDFETMSKQVGKFIDDTDKLIKSNDEELAKVLSKFDPDVQKDFKDIIDLFKKQVGKFEQVGEKVPENIVNSFIARLSSHEELFAMTDELKNILDSVLGKKNPITKVIDEIDKAKFAKGAFLDDIGRNSIPQFFRGDGDRILARTRATIDEANSIGFQFDESAIGNIVRSQLAVDRGVVMRGLVDDIGRRFGRHVDEAPSDWVRVNVSGLKQQKNQEFANFITNGSNLDNIKFHPAIAKRMENFMGSILNDEPTKEFLKKYDNLQNAWKASVTSIFPAFHGRNAISNVLMHMMDIGVHSLNPVNHAISAKIIKDDMKVGRLARKAVAGNAKAQKELTETLSRVVFKDNAGYEWTFGELRQVIKRNDVAFNYTAMGQMDLNFSQQKHIENFLSKKFSKHLKGDTFIPTKANPFSQEFAIWKSGMFVGSKVEEQSRILDFIVNLRKTGGDVQLAANRSKQFLFDYQNLTNFEREVMKRIFPFYSFTRKNLELQAKALFKTPGRVAAEVKAMTTLGDVISSSSLSEEEVDSLPEWLRDGINILRKRDGDNISIYNSLGTPLEQPFQAFQPNGMLGSVSPLIRVPVEQLSGYNFFAEKPLSESTNASAFSKAPESIKKFIGYTKVEGEYKDGEPFEWHVSLRPERMHLLLNLPPTSRVLTSLKQMNQVNVSKQDKLLQFIIGVRPFEFDLEQQSARREKEMAERLQNMLQDAGVVAKFQRAFIPAE